MKTRVEAKTFADGSILLDSHLDTDLLGDAGTLLGRQLVKTQDKAVRDSLVELGWTPPGNEVAVRGTVVDTNMSPVDLSLELRIMVDGFGGRVFITDRVSPASLDCEEVQRIDGEGLVCRQRYIAMTDGRAFLIDSYGVRRRVHGSGYEKPDLD